jgi:hypothetical protein
LLPQIPPTACREIVDKIMKANAHGFSRRLRGIFRRRMRRHDPMFVLNLSIFNHMDAKKPLSREKEREPSSRG